MVEGQMMSMPLNIASLIQHADRHHGSVVVRKSGETVSREELLAHFAGKVPRWQAPDDVAFVDAIPLGATGKMLKGQLRERFRDHRWPGA